MKRYLYWTGVMIIIPFLIITGGCGPEQKESAVLASEMDTVSYCVGIVFAATLERDGIDTMNIKKMTEGVSDYFKNKKKIRIDVKQAKMILLDFEEKQFMSHQLEKFSENKIAGEKFLEENAKRKGVVTLPSGLQYKIIKEGDGPKPGPNDLVKVYYKGELIDGTVFEEHLTGNPVPFFLNRVIDGWKEALQRMPQGSRWKIYVPYQLGYGTQTVANSPIEPFSTLIFDIELVEVSSRK